MKTEYEQNTTYVREQKKLTGGLMIFLAVLLAVLGLYGFLCASVNPNQVLPKTRIAAQGSGEQVLDLSGLDREGVLNTLERNWSAPQNDSVLTVHAVEKDYSVPVGDTLSMDYESAADSALAPSQAPFVCRGLNRLRSLVSWRDIKAQPTVGDEALLREHILNSGLLDVDTTVRTTYEVQDKALVLHKGKNGQSVDEDGLVEQIGNAVRAGDFVDPVECAMKDGQADLDWTAVEKEVCHKPQNAQLKLSEDRRNYEITDALQGVSFDLPQAQQELEAADEESDVSVALTYEDPDITAEQMRESLFKDKLGTYTTTVSGTSDRISNVRLAAEKCNGIILLHGDKLSYNDTLGERTDANGFKKAGAYLNGQTVQELGGGICQVSSTMYAAALDANLQIVERHNHTFASSYIGLGMDATVSWGGPDFVFENDKDYPIRIESVYEDGEAIVNIWGTRTDGKTVEMVSEVESTIPYPTVTKKKSGLKKGKTQVAQAGTDGYRVQTYRKVYEDGKLISNEKEAYSVYTPHEKIVYKGAGGRKSRKHKKKSKKSAKSKKGKKSKKSKKGKKR